MARETLRLTVVKDTCLGHEVYRGSALAGQLFEASWIDFHDPDSNLFGYQRDIDVSRSIKAADYAAQPPPGLPPLDPDVRAFWPECILAIRHNDNVAVEDQVHYQFEAIDGTDGRFGILSIDYHKDRVELINGTEVPWRRALSQVDCQHRLGNLGGSEALVTFCIFPELRAREEAIIFRTINAKQKKIDTSLADSIIVLTGDDAPDHTKWAWRLNRDVGSPYSGRIWTGGRGQKRADTLISLTGMRETLKRLMPLSVVRQTDLDFCYSFARNFWLVIQDLWPDEFADKKSYKLQTIPGQGGLAGFGQDIFREAMPAQEIGRPFIRKAFNNNPGAMDWKNTGELRLATGKGGQKNVLLALKAAYASSPKP